MPERRVVIGQKVTRAKAERAKQLRSEQTPAEAALWQRLRRSQLEGLHFRRQQVIAGFIVDFYCHAASLIVNVDGGVHHEQVEADAERDAILTARGFVSLHVTNVDVLNHMELTLERILQACRQSLPPRSDPSNSHHAGPPSRFGKGPGVRSP